MVYLLTFKAPTVIREAATAIANILQGPDGMQLWLKFNSTYLGIDCSGNNQIIVQGNPLKVTEGKGLYSNWGAAF